MGNGGPTPCCRHCTWFSEDWQQLRCTRYQFTVGIWAIRVMCRDLDIESEREWVRETVDATQLVPGMMYGWMEITYQDAGGAYHHNFDLYPLRHIHRFGQFSEDDQGEYIVQLHELNQQIHRKLGFRPT